MALTSEQLQGTVNYLCFAAAAVVTSSILTGCTAGHREIFRSRDPKSRKSRKSMKSRKSRKSRRSQRSKRSRKDKRDRSETPSRRSKKSRKDGKSNSQHRINRKRLTREKSQNDPSGNSRENNASSRSKGRHRKKGYSRKVRSSRSKRDHGSDRYRKGDRERSGSREEISRSKEERAEGRREQSPRDESPKRVSEKEKCSRRSVKGFPLRKKKSEKNNNSLRKKEMDDKSIKSEKSKPSKIEAPSERQHSKSIRSTYLDAGKPSNSTPSKPINTEKDSVYAVTPVTGKKSRKELKSERAAPKPGGQTKIFKSFFTKPKKNDASKKSGKATTPVTSLKKSVKSSKSRLTTPLKQVSSVKLNNKKTMGRKPKKMQIL